MFSCMYLIIVTDTTDNVRVNIFRFRIFKIKRKKVHILHFLGYFSDNSSATICVLYFIQGNYTSGQSGHTDQTKLYCLKLKKEMYSIQIAKIYLFKIFKMYLSFIDKTVFVSNGKKCICLKLQTCICLLLRNVFVLYWQMCFCTLYFSQIAKYICSKCTYLKLQNYFVKYFK